MRDKLYPAIKPYSSGKLAVSPLHTIYYEICGNPKGTPVFFVHGGPGGGLMPLYRRYFDPKHYMIVLFDQRGCGQSTPHAETAENTTWDLVRDMEKLRKMLKIKKFLLFGGSWGSTLSLAYATKHPENLLGMILRGIFLCRKEEIDWFYEGGASAIFPDLWDEYFLKPLKKKDHAHKLQAYSRLLRSKDPKKALEAAQCWSTWEGATSKLLHDPESIARFSDSHFATAFARIECHYFEHKAFFKTNNYLLQQAKKYAHLPGVIVQGRYDIVCPMKSAWDLHQVWPKAKFKVVPTAGHSAQEKGIIKELVMATEWFKTR